MLLVARPLSATLPTPFDSDSFRFRYAPAGAFASIHFSPNGRYPLPSMKTTHIGVIGCRLWGPTLLCNFAANEAARLRSIFDLADARLAAMGRRYPMAQTTIDYRKLVDDSALEAVAVVTPVATHFQIA